MQRNEDFRFVLVMRKSRLQELIERFNTWSQAKFYLEHNNVEVKDYLNEHNLYQKQLTEAELILKSLGRFQLLERGLLPSYQFSPRDIVVVIGQDGLVANTLKYLNGQPIIAINPDPSRWDGKLLPFEIGQLKETVINTINKKMPFKTVTFAQATTNDGQSLLAVNDLFIGPKSHTSARYILQWNGTEEVQSSSGIIVSTGLGSTGWFQSILAGAMAITGEASHPLLQGFSWSERKLQFSVREPFPSRTTGVALTFGTIEPDSPLQLGSLMPENGVIFSDGIEDDYLQFNAGCIAHIGIADIQGQLISQKGRQRI
ncbi:MULTISPECIES: sugar kinase [Proteus]|uniref:Sugar kinase n=1 Tax=Proteus terrae subsp. cibarius TaxID=626774 RepID=A0A6G6S4H4_9GAMM|nr:MULTISPECIES: sugar kinase [Proteus]QHP77711.1 sugar kinase [Proteus vulgaris]MBG2915544.1 sugar kinase [Proteus terrae subsp. cibarius]MBG3090326.1 sugar kinase [Proteus terrae subsp. cibarius]MCM2368016.1 sugar kinase [Proteus sp. FZP2095]QGW04376.1 sugar kinase [Proteus terrae subsp. cibarius]